MYRTNVPVRVNMSLVSAFCLVKDASEEYTLIDRSVVDSHGYPVTYFVKETPEKIEELINQATNQRCSHQV
jgi:hypothetical protein